MTRSIINLIFAFVLCLSFSSVFAQAKKGPYDDLGKRELSKLLDASCKKGMTASCFELGLLYQNFTDKKFKYDKIDYKKKGNELIKTACADGEENACDHLKGEDRFKGSQLLLWSAVLLVGIAVLIVTRMMFQDNEQFQASQKLDDDEDKKTSQSKSHGIVLQYSRPFFKRYVSPIVSQMKSKKKIKEKYRRKLASSGLTEVLTTEDFYAFKLFLIIGFPVVFIVVRQFMEADWPLKLVPVMAIVGFVYPDIWVKGKIQQRQKGIISGMPFAVDMLALSVEAGLDFIAAMTKVVEKARPGPLTEEFEIMIKEIKVGASRAEALRNMAWRIDLIPISSFCATLIAADSVGASIGPILKALSEEIRQKKSAEVEKEGATAATKILFPMMAFIIPAVFLMVAAPIIVEFVAGS